MRLDPGGRLLVGTSTARSNTSPLAGGDPVTFNLQHEGTSASAGLLLVRNSNNLNGGYLALGKTRATGAGGSTSVNSADILGVITFLGADGTNLLPGATIAAVVDGTPGADDMPGRLVFSTTADGASSPTERMRIDNAGSVFIGSPTGGYNPSLNFRRTSDGAATSLISLDGDLKLINASGSGGVMVDLNAGTPGNFTVFNITYERFRITGAGATFFPSIGTTASAANAFLNDASSPANQLLRSTSSLRYKTDVENLEQDRAAAILDFRPVWYRSLAEADRKDWSWYGLIAEEVAEIEPRLVHWTYLEDAYEEVEVEGERQLKPDAEMVPDGVQYDRLTVLLLDVVQRQQKAIETLEAKVASLEAQ
jgi:hypothetical protein